MDELQAGNPVIAGGVTFVPVERCVIQYDRIDKTCWFYALKEPFAIIVCDADGVRAFDMEVAEIPVDSLVQKIPELGEVLDDLSH